MTCAAAHLGVGNAVAEPSNSHLCTERYMRSTSLFG